MGMPGLFELLILAVPVVAVAVAVTLGVYFGLRRPRSRRARGFDVNPPGRLDKP
jgi:hypothetical protein